MRASLVFAATGLTATIIGGWLGTRWQRKYRVGYEWVLVISAVIAAPAGLIGFSISSLFWSKVCVDIAMFFLFLATGPVNTVILEAVPVMMRASAVAGSIFAIHMFGDVWSPPLIGWLSDKWGDLQRACLCVLPPALIVSAVIWIWLLIVRLREQKKATVPATAAI